MSRSHGAALKQPQEHQQETPAAWAGTMAAAVKSEADELIWRLEVEAETASTKAISRFLLQQLGDKSTVLRWG